MNVDVLSCKVEAIALAKRENPPLDQNGKKKGYIQLMEELWNSKDYGGLGFSRQNLRDQPEAVYLQINGEMIRQGALSKVDETDGILLIDATNAFNSLNRAARRHNICILCPIISVFAINAYRIPARLFTTGEKEILSSDGTTQGDPLSMGVYALSIKPLITAIKQTSSTKQCWFADDASGAGSLSEIKNTLTEIGPDFGYFPNAKKCWLIVKPEKEESAKELFQSTAINVTTEGHQHLGRVIGSQEFHDGYVNGKVNKWVLEITKLVEIAITEPQACYSAYIFGKRKSGGLQQRRGVLSTAPLEPRPIEKSIGAITHPCLTPVRTANDSLLEQLSRTLTTMPSCRSRRMFMNFSGQPYLALDR
ncbi:hypothetical protein AC249_AIPGENE23493 [Exaiptasia diaphana]|nr:hypothetical protein AC249_AIPGENE23493 [Exaiptasia diaphana]